MALTTERNTWPFWKLLKEKSRGQFIQQVWDTLGIDLLKEDKLGASVSYQGEIEDFEKIGRLMRQPLEYHTGGRR